MTSCIQHGMKSNKPILCLYHKPVRIEYQYRSYTWRYSSRSCSSLNENNRSVMSISSYSRTIKKYVPEDIYIWSEFQCPWNCCSGQLNQEYEAWPIQSNNSTNTFHPARSRGDGFNFEIIKPAAIIPKALDNIPTVPRKRSIQFS